MIANWVKQAVSSGGTGNLILGSASSGFITIEAALGLNTAFWYSIEDGTSREMGIGHLSASSTLVRDSVRETLVGGVLTRSSPSAINVTTAATVSITASAHSAIGAHPGYFFQNSGITGMCSLGDTDEASGQMAPGSSSYLLARPFLWGASKLVTHASIWVKTAASSSTVRVGLYEYCSAGRPGRLIAEAQFDSSTTGAKEVAFAAPIWLPSGYYFMAVQMSNGGVAIAAPQYSPAGLGLGVNSSGQRSVSLWRSRAFGAMPADESAETGYAFNNASFSVWLR